MAVFDYFRYSHSSFVGSGGHLKVSGRLRVIRAITCCAAILERDLWHKIFWSCFPLLFMQRPIISICWGHRDSRLLMASGPALYVVRVEHRVSSLQLLCQQTIASCLRDDKDISKLTLPPRLCSYLTTAFIPTIKVKRKKCVYCEQESVP